MIDSHAHVISADVASYPIVESARPQAPSFLTNPFTAERLLSEMDREHVGAALLVQRSQLYGFDNSYVCDGSVLGAGRLRPVCAIDARLSTCGHTARGWAERGAAGFRLMQQTRDEDLAWLGGCTAADLWHLCADRGLPLCVHFFPWNRERGIAQLLEMMRQFPETIVVVDHLSNCPIDAGGRLQTDDLLRRLAAQYQAYTKITTIPLGNLDKLGLSFAPLIDECRALFGFDRILWGSDITQSSGTYRDMTGHIRRFAADLSADEAHDLTIGNAARLYGLPSTLALEEHSGE